MDSLNQVEETDLMANLGFKRFHPPIQIRSYNNGSGFVKMDMDLEKEMKTTDCMAEAFASAMVASQLDTLRMVM
jgi:hypothetical protein